MNDTIIEDANMFFFWWTQFFDVYFSILCQRFQYKLEFFIINFWLVSIV